MHSIRMLTPLREFICIKREILLQLRNILGLLVEQDRAIPSLEAREFLLGSRPRLSGRDALDDRHDDVAPEFLVLGVEEYDDAGGLRVEGAGDVGDGFVDEVVDFGVRDRGRVGEGVVGATGFKGVEYAVGRHVGGCGCELRGMKRRLVGVAKTSSCIGDISCKR